MSLIGAAVIQANLGETGQLDFARTIAMIDDMHRAHFAIRIRRDANRPACFELAVSSPKFGSIGAEVAFVLISPRAQRLMADGPTFVVGQVADVTELAPTVTRNIFAPPGHIEAAPSAITGAGRSNHHTVLAVGKKRDRRNCLSIGQCSNRL